MCSLPHLPPRLRLSASRHFLHNSPLPAVKPSPLAKAPIKCAPSASSSVPPRLRVQALPPQLPPPRGQAESACEGPYKMRSVRIFLRASASPRPTTPSTTLPSPQSSRGRLRPLERYHLRRPAALHLQQSHCGRLDVSRPHCRLDHPSGQLLQPAERYPVPARIVRRNIHRARRQFPQFGLSARRELVGRRVQLQPHRAVARVPRAAFQPHHRQPQAPAPQAERHQQIGHTAARRAACIQVAVFARLAQFSPLAPIQIGFVQSNSVRVHRSIPGIRRAGFGQPSASHSPGQFPAPPATCVSIGGRRPILYIQAQTQAGRLRPAAHRRQADTHRQPVEHHPANLRKL